MLVLSSNTKINIGLKVINKRSDGLHDIVTIFQEIDFGDKIQFKKVKIGCNIKSNVDWIPLDDSNLCYKAHDVLSKKLNRDLGVEIYIEKKVPVGSGIGGGSANAAATLLGINSLYNLGLDNKQLEIIGSHIGADVPFFYKRGCTSW